MLCCSELIAASSRHIAGEERVPCLKPRLGDLGHCVAMFLPAQALPWDLGEASSTPPHHKTLAAHLPSMAGIRLQQHPQRTRARSFVGVAGPGDGCNVDAIEERAAVSSALLLCGSGQKSGAQAGRAVGKAILGARSALGVQRLQVDLAVRDARVRLERVHQLLHQLLHPAQRVLGNKVSGRCS